MVSDRWNGYSHLDPNQRQVCWSHLQRDFRRHAEGLAEQKTFGEHGLELTRRVFAAWRAYQHEHHDRDRLQAEIAPIQTELRQLLEARLARRADAPAGTASSPTTCSRSGPRSGPSPPSTASSRPTTPPSARSAARSSTENSRSAPKATTGERFAERALSAAATCRLQRRSLFTYLSELLTAHNRGDPFPALT